MTNNYPTLGDVLGNHHDSIEAFGGSYGTCYDYIDKLSPSGQV